MNLGLHDLEPNGNCWQEHNFVPAGVSDKVVTARGIHGRGAHGPPGGMPYLYTQPLLIFFSEKLRPL